MGERHTPGPWLRIDTADYAEIHAAFRPSSQAVAIVAKPSDADLIAAAPEMLAALEEIGGKLAWLQFQAGEAMAISAGCATTHGDDGGALEMLNSIASDIDANVSIGLEKVSAVLAKIAGKDRP